MFNVWLLDMLYSWSDGLELAARDSTHYSNKSCLLWFESFTFLSLLEYTAYHKLCDYVLHMAANYTVSNRPHITFNKSSTSPFVMKLVNLPLLREVVRHRRRIMQRVLYKLWHQFSTWPRSDCGSWTVNDSHGRPFNRRLQTRTHNSRMSHIQQYLTTKISI